MQGSVEAVLVTVVKVEGSAYRQPGARMLILPDGQSVGMISGGCLEKHVIQRAFWLTRYGAVTKTYTTAIEPSHSLPSTQNDISSLQSIDEDWDEQEGFGLGCQGSIQVLFERIVADRHTLSCQQTLFRCFWRLRHDLKPQHLATVIHSTSKDFLVGQHLYDGVSPDTWTLLQRTPASRKSRSMIETYQVNDQQIHLFVEQLTLPLHLIVFGAGQDVFPVVEMALIQGWRVTLVDSRAEKLHQFQHRLYGIATCEQSEYAPKRSQFYDQAVTFCSVTLPDLGQVQALFELPHPKAVVIMTHSLAQDRIWLNHALLQAERIQFIGQLGPRYRTEQLLHEIAAVTGKDFSSALPKHFFYPVGLPLGGDTPEAVALSIIAHIQAHCGHLL